MHILQLVRHKEEYSRTVKKKKNKHSWTLLAVYNAVLNHLIFVYNISGSFMRQLDRISTSSSYYCHLSSIWHPLEVKWRLGLCFSGIFHNLSKGSLAATVFRLVVFYALHNPLYFTKVFNPLCIYQSIFWLAHSFQCSASESSYFKFCFETQFQPCQST